MTYSPIDFSDKLFGWGKLYDPTTMWLRPVEKFVQASSQYLSVPHNAALNFQGGVMSLSCWIRRTTITNASNETGIASKRDPATGLNGAWSLAFGQAGGHRLEFTWYNTTSSSVRVDFNNAGAQYLWLPNVWAHLYLECDGSQATDFAKIKAWINGIALTPVGSDGTTITTTKFANGTGTFQLGKNLDTLPTLDGELADFTLWNALMGGSTAATSLYNAGFGRTMKATVRVMATSYVFTRGVQTVDGVALSDGDRVLINIGSRADSGIWVVNASGPWTRAADMDNWSEVVGAQVYVTSGTTYGGTVWQTAELPSPYISNFRTIGRYPFSFTQLGAASPTFVASWCTQASGGTLKDQGTLGLDLTRNGGGASATRCVSQFDLNRFDRGLGYVAIAATTIAPTVPLRKLEPTFDPNGVSAGKGCLVGAEAGNYSELLTADVSHWNISTITTGDIWCKACLLAGTPLTGEQPLLGLGNSMVAAGGGEINNSDMVMMWWGPTTVGAASKYALGLRMDGSSLSVAHKPNGSINCLKNSFTAGVQDAGVQSGNTNHTPGTLQTFHYASVDTTTSGTGAVAGPYRAHVDGAAQIVSVANGGDGLAQPNGFYSLFPSTNMLSFGSPVNSGAPGGGYKFAEFAIFGATHGEDAVSDLAAYFAADK